MKHFKILLLAITLIAVCWLPVNAQEGHHHVSDDLALVSEDDLARAPVVPCPLCTRPTYEVTEWTDYYYYEEVDCIHKPHGTDMILRSNGTTYQRCHCGYSRVLSDEGYREKTECHGYY